MWLPMGANLECMDIILIGFGFVNRVGVRLLRVAGSGGTGDVLWWDQGRQ